MFFKKKEDENQELIEMLKEQVRDLEPGSEEQMRAVKCLRELQSAKQESKRSIRELVTGGFGMLISAATFGLAIWQSKKPYDAQKENLYVTDRIGQDTLREGKSNVKDLLKKKL